MDTLPSAQTFPVFVREGRQQGIFTGAEDIKGNGEVQGAKVNKYKDVPLEASSVIVHNVLMNVLTPVTLTLYLDLQ